MLSGYTSLVNMFGCPAISLPVADESTPPPAVHLVAAPWQEELLLDVGEALEGCGLVASIPTPA